MVVGAREVIDREFFKVLLDGFDEKLRIPDKFVEECLPRGQEKVNLNSSILGKVWTVKIRCHSDGFYFSGDGWKEFVRDHDLHFGYFLVFVYCWENINNFFVKPFDHSGCRKFYAPIDQEDKTMNQHAAVNVEQCVNKATAIDDDQNQIQNQFKIVMASSYIQYMHFPSGFRDSNNLSSISEVTLTGKDGRRWLVKFRHTPRKNRLSSAFSIGWKAFKNENNLQKDDVCIFYLSSKDENTANFFVIFQQKRRKQDNSKVVGRKKNRKARNQSESIKKKPILQTVQR
ncbi:hypothetical protein ZOSMA_205G00240 [Zostera marina]|uniref:TF-B3 domain-containing protein n=1 Tax=Zostera marina TaxID=29655 RepID=A0A0K9PLA9_ZOSMR|nr:hypothetical protein ZOSMA_205G00240 [Zostera marina]